MRETGEEVDTLSDSTDQADNTAGEGGEGNEQGERPLSPREQAMADIERRVEEDRQQEMNTVSDDGDQQGQNIQQEPQQAAVVPVQDQPRMVKVKVDGVEMEVPESEVIANYQIRAHAQNKVNEANTAREQAEAIKKQAEMELEAARSRTSPAVTDEDVLERSRKILTDMQAAFLEGDNLDEMAGELAALVAGGRNSASTTLDEEQIVERVLRKQSEQAYEQDFTKAKSLFDEKFSDINADPFLAEVCNNNFNRELQSGKMPSEAALAAGNATREWVQKLSGRPAGAPVTNIATRTALKQTLNNITPASGQISSGSNEPGADTASVIAEMKKSRGQV